ncbi:MAG: aldo/keto reductase [Desulfovibrio sp.]|nr:aldo/keto reductase [Desulfovibrio sp.]
MKKLGFGLMRLPLTDSGDNGSIDQKIVDKMVDYYLEYGFAYFDTAYVYHAGMSEISARKAVVERYRRDKFSITDKMPTWLVTSASDYEKIFTEQLARCGVEYFDYYLLHNIGIKRYTDTRQSGGFEFMRKIREEGRAGHVGFSYHDKAELLDRILTEHPEMEYVQLQINYMDWENEAIQSRKCYETARKHGKPVIVMEPVKGGSLAGVPQEADKLFRMSRPGMSAVSWAIRFAASLEGVFMVLSGMSDFEQVADNVSYMCDFVPLSDKERETINKVAAIIDGNMAIPCTSCGYCFDGCPRRIPIPQYFALYNNQKQFGLLPNQMAYYMNLTQEHGTASDCCECGQCEEHCPQHIDIAEQMKEVAGVFDSR